MRPPPPAVPAPWRLPALLAGVLLGTAAQLQQPRLWGWPAYAALLACGGLATLWLWRRCGARWARLALVLAAATVVAGTCGLRALAFAADALEPALEGQDLQVVGVIATMPQPREDGVRFRLRVEQARRGAQPVRLPPLVDLGWYAGAWGEEAGAGAGAVPPLRAGERWALTLRLKAPHGTRNPGGFDYELWLWEQGVQASGYVRSSARLDALHGAPALLGQTRSYPLQQLRQRVRGAILGHLATEDADAGRRRAAGVVAALVTGDQRAIERGDWQLFRSTGVAHLMSISGLHITMFAWLAAALVGALWRRSERLCLCCPAPTAALAGGVLLAGAYALFSGWGVPAQRTLLMLGTALLLRALGRRWPWHQAWLLAAALVLLADPWAWLQAGFWLSFVAIGILFATDTEADGARPAGIFWRFHALLRQQAVLTLALAPLTLLLFGQVSLVGLVANLLAIPWVTLLVTPLAFAGLLWAPLWQLGALCVESLALWLEWLARWPGAQLFLPQAPLWAGLAAAAGGVLLVLRLPWQLRALGLVLAWPALLWQAPRPVAGQFDLLAADVGQGQAVLVRTARHSLLYDAGPRYGSQGDAGAQLLVPLLRTLGERIDLLLLSHGDSDHVGGAAALLAEQPQARVLGSVEAASLPPGTPWQRCAAGLQWEWDGVRFALLHPSPARESAPVPAPARGRRGKAAGAPHPNALSCVLRVEAAARGGEAARAALLPGDLERAQEEALVASGAPLAADLLLVPHHGSKTSSSAALLEAVRPAQALVQSGYRNRFGHPAREVVQRYAQQGAALYDSPRCGAAWWSSAQAVVRCERDAHRRYWQHDPPP